MNPIYNTYAQIPLEEGVEVWLAILKAEVEDTIKAMLCQVIQDINANQALEDLVFKVYRLRHM